VLSAGSQAHLGTTEGHRENLNQANKLSRTYAVLLDALNRHRGKASKRSQLSTSTFMLAGRRWSAWSGPWGAGVNRN
jgi:hypothetical protein